MSDCTSLYPDTHLTDADRAAAARILARPASSTAPCLTYARLYWRWVQASENDQPVLLSEMRNHIRICGCRMAHEKPMDTSWIFAEPEEVEVEV